MALEEYARNAVKDTLQDVALQVGLIGYRSAVACQDLLEGVNCQSSSPWDTSVLANTGTVGWQELLRVFY